MAIKIGECPRRRDQIRLSIAVFRPKTHGRGFSLALIGLGLIASIAVMPAAAATDPALPAAEALPSNVIAFVTHVPLSLGRLTEAEFQRALVQQAAQAGRSSVPGPNAKDYYPRLSERALDERLEAISIQGQAREMGIGVRPHEISRELAHIKKQAFKNEAQYRHFLREAHFTNRDVRERVMIQILSEKIQVRVVAGLSETEAQRAFNRFVKEYAVRWRGRTVCAPDHVTDRCSNGPELVGS